MEPYHSWMTMQEKYCSMGCKMQCIDCMGAWVERYQLGSRSLQWPWPGVACRQQLAAAAAIDAAVASYCAGQACHCGNIIIHTAMQVLSNLTVQFVILPTNEVNL